MSKYPVLYHSKSKGVDLAIEDMATPHLMNTLRKLALEQPVLNFKELASCMVKELVSRGCTLDPETGRMPPAPEAAPSGEVTL